MAISFENDDFCGAIVSGQVPRLAAIRSLPLPVVGAAAAGSGVAGAAAAGAAVAGAAAGACVASGALATGAEVAAGVLAAGCPPPHAARIGRISARSRATSSRPRCLCRFIVYDLLCYSECTAMQNE